ncbi:hypothetical protein PC129_g14011 [Phytophthora cactorum]|uniref:RxLR effector protein n=1 Tax=Phytophthora cactorum TaxID=29920 RepID=A0A329RXC2_9STRA|nr:hypothetical protein Pcac1_g4745 [Phytophthora cactorum]KAG2811078.1 hypothetical protein PC112_g15779 [Phytophthora cactorum]KAG2812498.1 hypothetical protein PC111_g14788 [Phytophthora cactorum]KAG2851496.1 hypothetical protein PC113_g15865 [Phytophthora cactorum]KAG2890596.1 hypothetical protein PC114_g17376 [Phytophthora cactorum]
MRAHFVVLFVVATLVASTGALSTAMDSRGAIGITSPGTPKSKENGSPTKRYLRKKKSVDEGDEERVSTSQFSSVEKVLEKLPSLEKKEILDGVNQLSHADKAALTKRLASLERLEISLDTGKVPGIIKKFSDSKLVRLMQYNVWIQCKKTPEWVETNYPAFAKGFDTFYHNRMTPGYKYA